MPPQDRIIMVKRMRPIQVRLSSGRTFILRCKISTRVAVPPNIELNRRYKQRPAPKTNVRDVQQRSSRGKVSEVSLNLEKIVKNPLVTKLRRAALNELLQYNFYSKGTSKIKNKKLKRILQSDIANSLVDMGAEYS